MSEHVTYRYTAAVNCPTAGPLPTGVLRIDETKSVWFPKSGGGWGQSPAGVSGAGNWSTLGDKATADLPGDNAPLATALAAKASSASLTAGLALKGNLAGGNSWTGLQTITPAVGASALVVANVTQTTSQPMLALAQTWNAGAVVFTALDLNVTDTASDASSLLMNFRVGGSSRASIRKDGNVISTGATCGYMLAGGAVYGDGAGAGIASNATFGFSSTTNGAGTRDVVIVREAAGVWAQRNAANAQEHRAYGTYTDPSNYRRLSKGMSAAGVAFLRPEGAGTGASGNVLQISGFPTSNPGPGILWNNAGTPAIGT